MIKVMYLICLERIIGYGIFETQVKNLLFSLKKKFGSELDITLTSVIPILHIRRKGIDFNFLKYRKGLGELGREFSENGLKLRLLPALKLRWGIYLRLFTLIFFVFTVFPLVLIESVKNKYDVIHCRGYLSPLIAYLIKRCRKNVKIIFDSRAPIPEEGVLQRRWGERSQAFKMWKRIEKRLLTWSDRVTTISEPMREHFLQIDGHANVLTIPNSVDVAKFRLDEKEKHIMRKNSGLVNRKVIVYDGGLGTWNDPQVLADIFKHIKTKIRNSYLLVITTFDREKLTQKLKAKGLTEHDFGIVNSEPDNVPLYLNIGAYGVWPSRSVDDKEGCSAEIRGLTIGIKTAEYMASGLPIIANENIKGVAGLIEKYNIGVTFGLENLHKLNSKIDYLENNYSELQKNCLRLAEEYFDVERHAKLYFEIYRELTNSAYLTQISNSAVD